MVTDTIDDVNEIIDDYTVNELYEERGHNFEAEYYDYLVFSITNYAQESASSFRKTVDEIVNEIERQGYVVFDVRYDQAYAIIEVSKD